MRFKMDWASCIVGSKFMVIALFYFVFEGNFPSKSPLGAYIWRGLFSEFYGMCDASPFLCCPVQNFMCFDVKFSLLFGELRLRDSIITASNKLDHYRQDRIAGGSQG